MTEEEIVALQQELADAKAEAEKQKSIKAEVIAARDEYKKKYGEVEHKIVEFEQALVTTQQQLDAERTAREQIVSLHSTTIKKSAVKQALEKQGVNAIDTALKLVKLDDITLDDEYVINTDTVEAVVSKLKETDSVLFTQTVTKADAIVPKPKRASEGEPKAGFSEEVKLCKTAAEVEALLRKHGKI